MSWTAHATIAKKSAAISSFKSVSEFKRNRDALSITNDLVYRVMSSLYGGDMNYYFGDYLFSEIELNEMKLDGDGYYVTPEKVPIYAQSPIPLPPSFHPIQKPVIVEERQTTVLPERHSTLCDCPQCHLHFSSERQLKRHMRFTQKKMLSMPLRHPLLKSLHSLHSLHSQDLQGSRRRDGIEGDHSGDEEPAYSVCMIVSPRMCTPRSLDALFVE